MPAAACAVNVHRLVFARSGFFAVWVHAVCRIWLFALLRGNDFPAHGRLRACLTPKRMMTTNDDALHGADILRIGGCTVTLSSREVQVPGMRRPRRLTPKALGVLCVLVRSQGRVVTRDELFAEVWPDTLPTNDVLTQAVTQLRKAFTSADEQGTAYIETIAKSGYRLLVPVTLPDAPQSMLRAEPPDSSHGSGGGESSGLNPSGVEPQGDMAALDSGIAPGAATLATSSPAAVTATAMPGQRQAWRQFRRRLLLVVGVAMLVALAVMTWLLQRTPASTPLEDAVENGTRVIGSPQRPYRLITAGTGFQTYPTLSPDGSQVAYESSAEDGRGGQIKVQTSGNAPARDLLERPAGATDRFPHWSPDGREIAFARFQADGRCQVLIVSATGGNLREAARCDGTELLSFDWMPDGRGLVFGSMVGAFGHRGIRVLDLSSGHWKALVYPAQPDDFDYAPQVSPDGRWLVFVRNPQVGDLWRMPAEGGALEQLTDDAAEIRGWAWLGDSRHIVFGRRVDSEVRLYRLDTDSRTMRDVGLDDAQWPAVARRADLLAFVQRKAQFGLFHVPLDAPGRAQRMFPSSGRDSQPTLSPDGRHLVFTSDRSGAYALWWANLDRPASLRPIDGLRPDSRQAPTWSPDGRHLLVIGRDERGQSLVYEITPREDQLSVLPVPATRPLQALYTDDPDRLLVIERDDEQRTRLVLYDRRQAAWKPLAAIEGVSQARFDPSQHRVLFTRFGAGGLWAIDSALAAASIRQIGEDRPSRWRYRSWTVTAQGDIDYLDASGNCSTSLFRMMDASQMTAESCVDRQRLSSGSSFSATADGSSLYVAMAVSDGSDIGVMSMPKATSDLLPDVVKPLISKD